MSTLLNKSYLVKVSTKGGGGVKNAPNSVYVVCTQPHSLLFLSKSVFVPNVILQFFDRTSFSSEG